MRFVKNLNHFVEANKVSELQESPFAGLSV
jgi:hypothetical protein